MPENTLAVIEEEKEEEIYSERRIKKLIKSFGVDPKSNDERERDQLKAKAKAKMPRKKVR